MITRLFNKCLLRPSDFKPSQDDLEVIGAFNPGAAQTEDGIVLLVRIAEQARERRMGQTALPRWDLRAKCVVLDWVQDTEIAPVDVRVVRSRKHGLIRLTFTSHLQIVRSKDGRNIDSIDTARFAPETEYEEFGVEDPRITKIAGT
ncbi:MAG TPA: glycosylase, partial [Verrucomicrobiae bacterium]|nr:glycosylase [Verrucomicrobiae bacterium]